VTSSPVVNNVVDDRVRIRPANEGSKDHNMQSALELFTVHVVREGTEQQWASAAGVGVVADESERQGPINRLRRWFAQSYAFLLPCCLRACNRYHCHLVPT
jgi:hypothetical protein